MKFISAWASKSTGTLRALADRIDGHPHFSSGHSQALRDINGNEVGNAVVTD